ncbi:hypothetical protein JVU11DRAFT_6270 [Chiua virens]|nr:hypothetical protein JVU11DRAFT_6270 [Chiua virens]
MGPLRNKTGCKYSTVDATYKLVGSLPVPKDGCNVTTMDKFVSMELQGKIINERCSTSTQASRSLSFFLDLIFANFSQEFGDVTPESLAIPLSSILTAARRPVSSYNIPAGSDTVEIYDKESKRWRWNFPSTDPPSDQLAHATPASSDTPSDPQSPQVISTEWQVAIFFNCLTKAFTDKQPQNGPRRQWLVNWSQTPLSGSTGFVHKPDLILVDNSDITHDKVMWLSIKVVGEYTKEIYQPASHIGKTMDTKAYLVLMDQPWRCFVLGVSIASFDLQVHLYNHSGGVVSPLFNIHTNTQQFLFIITALAFGCRSSIGFDLAIKIHPPPFSRGHSDSVHASASNPKGSKDPPESIKEWDGLPHRTSLNPIELKPSSLIASPALPTVVEPSSPPPLAEPPLPLIESPSTPPPPGEIPLSPVTETPIPAIGKIRVDDVWYEIINILFSSMGFVGRGTVCYLARLDGVYFVIKDHWVWDLDQSGGIRDP